MSESVALNCVQLYIAGLSTAEVGRKLGVSSSTVLRHLKKQGVPTRKRWSTDNGVKDGQKKCPMCNKWQPKSNFYSRKDGTPYSYCKPCDRERAVDSGRKSRHIKRQQAQTIRTERRHHNTKSRMLLADTLQFLQRMHPDIDLADDIKAHLSLTRRLFGERVV